MLLHANSLAEYEVIDTESLSQIMNADAAVADADGHVGHIVATISPGLKRARIHEESALVLVKPKVLAKFFMPPRRLKKQRTG